MAYFYATHYTTGSKTDIYMYQKTRRPALKFEVSLNQDLEKTHPKLTFEVRFEQFSVFANRHLEI